MEELAKKIELLLNSKDISIIDDYLENIFVDSNSNELFRSKHPRVIDNNTENEQVANDIIIKLEAITNEKSLLAVLVYLIVAQFGVFSSPTLSAPNVQVGMMFFMIFIVGIIIFTKSTYKNTKTAMTYFGVTFVVALFLSFSL